MELGRGSYFRRAVWQGDILAETQSWSGESHLDIRGKRAQGKETAVAKAWRGDRCWTERMEAACLERIGRGRVGGGEAEERQRQRPHHSQHVGVRRTWDSILSEGSSV